MQLPRLTRCQSRAHACERRKEQVELLFDGRIQDLPQEVFDKIYDFTFTVPKGATCYIHQTSRPPSLLGVDRTSRSKYAHSYYGDTVFALYSATVAARWLVSLPPEHSSVITTIRYYTATLGPIWLDQYPSSPRRLDMMIRQLVAEAKSMIWNFRTEVATRGFFLGEGILQVSMRRSSDYMLVWTSNPRMEEIM